MSHCEGGEQEEERDEGREEEEVVETLGFFRLHLFQSESLGLYSSNEAKVLNFSVQPA